jgi:transposase InsO family protein
MKTLKVEAVYPMAFETFQDVIEQLPHFIEEFYNKRRLHSALGYLSPKQFEDQQSIGLENGDPRLECAPGHRTPSGHART